MYITSNYRWATVLAVAAMLGLGLTTSTRAAAPFQPLNSPATNEHRPGKFVWADLFTTDPVAAAKFYTGLQFGLSSCVTDGYVGVGTGVYYGPQRDPWFRDDPWMDGHRWYGEPRGNANVGVYIHPPQGRR